MCNDWTSGATWKDCTLRSWLNDNFYRSAFSETEQEVIQPQIVVNNNSTEDDTEEGNNTDDKVYLLSIDEVTNPAYGFCEDDKTLSASRSIQSSAYTQTRGASIYKGMGKDNVMWWLRSSGLDTSYFAQVDEYGHIHSDGYYGFDDDEAVVPALHVDISSDLWYTEDDGTSGSGGGKISSKAGEDILHSGRDGDLTWSIDANGLLRISGEGNYNFHQWVQYASDIKTAVVEVSGITSTRYMFKDCCYLKTLDVSNFDTSHVTDMEGMFDWCRGLELLDVSKFNTSQVTNMSGMFSSCKSLETLDVSNFDTGQVTNMRSIFNACSDLTELDVSSFDTSQVTDMAQMFCECSSLTELDVSNFDTRQVTNMRYMFWNCRDLKLLDVSSFNTSQVTDMNCMFGYCRSLTSLDVSSFNTSQVMSMGNMFYDCSALTIITMPAHINLDVDLPSSQEDDYGDWKDTNGVVCTVVTKDLDTPMTYIRSANTTKPDTSEQAEAPNTDQSHTSQLQGGQAADAQGGQTTGTGLAAEPSAEQMPETKGTTLTDKVVTTPAGQIPVTATFTVTSSDPANPTVAFNGVKDKNAKAVKIPKVVVFNGVEYKVTTVSITNFEKQDAQYKVMSNQVENLTITYNGATKAGKKKSTVSIPEYANYKGIRFKVVSVSAKSFKGNKKVTNVKIATSITRIGDNAFEGCSNLKSVTVGKSLEVIGKNAFKNCKSLTKLTLKSSELKKVGKNALKGINANCTIKVPAKSVKKYKKLLNGKGQKRTLKISKI